MASYKILLYSFFSILVLSCHAQPDTTMQNKSGIKTNKGFAVVELFTSEGCSSCPPADKLLGEIEQKYEGQDVFLLSYHVDYWNRLGWTDKFSSEKFTKRQYAYSSAMGKSGVYTPQAIINGGKEIVGSNRSLYKLIDDTRDQISHEPLLGKVQTNGNKISANYQMSKLAIGQNLVINLVQKNASTKVLAGENAGRVLPHTNVVCELKVISVENSVVMAELLLPKAVDAKNYKIIAFLQDKKTMNISAATQNELE